MLMILSIFTVIWVSCSLVLYLTLSDEIDIYTILMGPFGFMILYLEDKKEKTSVRNAKYKVGDKVKIKVYLGLSDCEIVEVSIKSVQLKNKKVVYKVRGSYGLDPSIFLYTLTEKIPEEHILSDRKSRINKLY